MFHRLVVRNFALITLIVIGFIVYGSLYPFAFHRMPPGAVHALLEHWNRRPQRGDAVANVLLYMPLGYFALLSIRREAGALPRLLLAALLGSVLSISIELTQYYDAGRDTEATDVYTNIAGTILGAAAALWLGSRLWKRLPLPLLSDPAAAMLLAAWTGYNLFPFAPVIDLHKYYDALKPLLHPAVTPYQLFTHVAAWCAVAALVREIAQPRQVLLTFAGFAAAVLGAKIVIAGTVLTAAELGGAAAALAFLAALKDRPRPLLMAAFALQGVSVAAQRLEPFHFTGAVNRFGWIPFLSFMRGSIGVDTMAFLEKSFLYGSLIWLLLKLGMRPATATACVAAALLVTSIAETHLPGRSAEITDAVLALFAGGVIVLVRPASRRAILPD